MKFETGPVQTGAARLFRADVEVTDRPGAPPHAETLEVNQPLNIDGTTVHLIGHGYAPMVTVKDGDGNVAFSGRWCSCRRTATSPRPGRSRSPDARPERLGVRGLLPARPPWSTSRARGRSSPTRSNPALFLNAWSGPPKAETGRPENVYSLDTTGLTQLKDANGEPVRLAAAGRATASTLPDGKGIDPAGRLDAAG